MAWSSLVMLKSLLTVLRESDEVLLVFRLISRERAEFVARDSRLAVFCKAFTK